MDKFIQKGSNKRKAVDSDSDKKTDNEDDIELEVSHPAHNNLRKKTHKSVGIEQNGIGWV